MSPTNARALDVRLAFCSAAMRLDLRLTANCMDCPLRIRLGADLRGGARGEP